MRARRASARHRTPTVTPADATPATAQKTVAKSTRKVDANTNASTNNTNKANTNANANGNASGNTPTTKGTRSQTKPLQTEAYPNEAPDVGVATRPSRERKPRTTFSPAVDKAATRPYNRRQDATAATTDAQLPADELCRRLEARVRSSVKQLRYLQAFLDAYETEGWRRASREKLKPSSELARARRKMTKAKRSVVDTLLEMDRLRQIDPRIPYLIEMETHRSEAAEHSAEGGEQEHHPERIYCSRCSVTDTAEDNDILLCDNVGCCRAYHQQCQIPTVRTQEIPEGDEPWFCASCLAIFNALKAINYACDTTHENISDVFPELVQEEQSLLTSDDYDVSTAEGTAEETEGDAGDDEDDDEDEDFTVDVEQLKADGSNVESSESGEEIENTSADEGVLESEVSDDELRHLHNGDIIDANRRSTRSRVQQATEKIQPADTGHLGDRVAKQNDDGTIVFGVVVELDHQQQPPHWRIVYYDDTMALMDEYVLTIARSLASKHENSHVVPDDVSEDVDPLLIVRGKRKRTCVDYRALNEMMFDGQEDSDAGDDIHVESDEEEHEAACINAVATGKDDGKDGDYELPKTGRTAASSMFSSGKRGRRVRRSVDYAALHEGR